MKKMRFLMLALLITLSVGAVVAAVIRLPIVYFEYTGPTNPPTHPKDYSDKENFTEVTINTLPTYTGNQFICYLEFDAADFPLEDGGTKPPQSMLNFLNTFSFTPSINPETVNVPVPGGGTKPVIVHKKN